jgi:uncharacterized protein YkwD
MSVAFPRKLPMLRLLAAILISGLLQAAAPGPVIGEPAAAAQPLANNLAFTGCARVDVPPQNATYEQRVIELVNQERANAGLSALTRQTDLDYAARYHAIDMLNDNYFSHNSYDRQNGSLVQVCNTSTRLKLFYPNLSAWGENIAAGYATPEDVIAGWMGSPGHRANILNPNFHVIGVGYATGGGDYGSYWVQDFDSRLCVPTLSGLPASAYFLYEKSTGRLFTASYTLQPADSCGSLPFTWTASAADAWLTISPASGTAPAGTFTISPAASILQSVGDHTTTLTVTAAAVSGSPKAIQVIVTVVEALNHKTFLPILGK